MKYIIVGVAGHINHGKTALVEAVCGYSTASKEELDRGMTLFARYSSIQRDNTIVAFIDVPGHKELISKMALSAFAYGVTLFVVSAKEGISAQTIEHLKVLNIVSNSLVIAVVTKTDLVTTKRIKEVEESIKELFKSYKNIKLNSIQKVSVYDNSSVSKLLELLYQFSAQKSSVNEPFRAYIDRVFDIKGRGKVVTTTVLNGTVDISTSVFHQKSTKKYKIKSIEQHHSQVEYATKDTRVAMLLDIKRVNPGDILYSGTTIDASYSVDIALEYNYNIKHNSFVKVVTVAGEVSAKILLYSDSNFARLKFDKEVFLCFQDRVLLLDLYGVIGGGEVLIPLSEPIRKRAKIELLQYLYCKDFTKALALLSTNHKKGLRVGNSWQRFGIEPTKLHCYTNSLRDCFYDTKVQKIYSKESIKSLREEVLSIFAKNKMALVSAKLITNRFKWCGLQLAEYILESENILQKEGQLYFIRGYTKASIKESIKESILKLTDSITPPSLNQMSIELSVDITVLKTLLNQLEKEGRVYRVTSDIYITPRVKKRLIESMLSIITKEGQIDIQSWKSYISISRKYAIAYLEMLDNLETIQRVGGVRLALLK